MRISANGRDWREPALRLMLGWAQAGGHDLSGEEMEDIFNELGEGYGKADDVGVHLQRLPQTVRNLFIPLMEVVEAVRREQIPDHRPRVCGPEDILLVCGAMIYKERELLKVLFLNGDSRLLSHYDAALGNANRVWVEPRPILRAALEWEARKIVILHNHPSGNLEPGEEDIAFTRKMERGCKFLGIKLLDHIILGPNKKSEKKYFSFVEKKLL